MTDQARITELEQAISDLLRAVKKRSAWDYSDVLDEVLDAEYIMGKRGTAQPPLPRAQRFDWSDERFPDAPCPKCGAPITAHMRQARGGPLCPRYRLPTVDEGRLINVLADLDNAPAAGGPVGAGE